MSLKFFVFLFLFFLFLFSFKLHACRNLAEMDSPFQFDSSPLYNCIKGVQVFFWGGGLAFLNIISLHSKTSILLKSNIF